MGRHRDQNVAEYCNRCKYHFESWGTERVDQCCWPDGVTRPEGCRVRCPHRELYPYRQWTDENRWEKD